MYDILDFLLNCSFGLILLISGVGFLAWSVNQRMNQRFHYLVQLVANLRPGESIEIPAAELESCRPASYHNGALFSSADWVLENIVGSSYEWSYHQSHVSNTYVFARRLRPTTDIEPVTYMSPDRRRN